MFGSIKGSALPVDDRLRRRTRLRFETLEDRTVPTAVLFSDTFNWMDMASVTATVTQDAPGYEGKYLWEYHLVNTGFYPDDNLDISVFAIAVGEPENVADLWSTRWQGSVGTLQQDPNLVSWVQDQPNTQLGIGQSADFRFTTLPTEIVMGSGFVADGGLAAQAGGAVAAPIQDPFKVTTVQDVVNPADGFVSLREAITYANSRNGFVPPEGFNIHFDPGVFGGAQSISLGSKLPACTVKMSILGTGMNTLTIAGGGSKGIFTIAAGIPVSISNLMVRDGFNTALAGGSGTGGGFDNGGNLTLNSIRISNCSASRGGGIQTTSVLTMSNCEIIGCTALSSGGGGFGGGLHVAAGGAATVDNSEVRDCVGAARGGGIAIIGTGQAHLTDTNVLNNQATSGAGIYNSGATLSMSNGSLMDNTATTYGGGIEAGGTTTLDNVTLKHNIANGPGSLGGGLYLVSDDFTMTGGVIEQCSAVTGGAIYVKGGTNTFRQGVIIRDNSASGWGGVSYSESGNLEFNGCTFSGNQATNGAPLFARKTASQAVVTVTGCDGAGQNDVVNAP